ncbi:hypothetical protein LAY41_30755 [Argonema galeatum A003/A1]|nr:hypothetical protein [Argonema galeatum]MCL1468772.1 hypothetical protein [Argonema galeatum A003/A1]
MNTRSNTCPCCGSGLLRHIRHEGIYWFCTSCHQEVPSLLSIRMLHCDTLKQQSRPLSVVSS